MGNEHKYFDIEHIKNFMEGDESSFNLIYEHYRKRVFYMGMQLFHNDEERSKDLVQNTFTQVYINIKKLKTPEAFYIWMSKIAYIQGCGMLRYHSKDTSYYIKDDLEDLGYTLKEVETTDGITEIQQKDAIDLILSELNIMDENRRLIGYLRYFEELSIKEITQITGIKENTVMSHLHRIKIQLKEKLESYGFTKSTCLSLLIAPNLTSYYNLSLKTNRILEFPGSDTIIDHSKRKEEKKDQVYWMRISKVALAIGIGASFTSIAGIEARKQYNETVLPAFTRVEFEKKIVNNPIKIDVKTTNKNYDAILLNDSSDLVVYQNGVYTLKLIKTGQTISTKTLVITNIDMNAPQVAMENIQEDYIYFEFLDDLSGVDYEKISLYINGVVSNDVKIDMENNRVIVAKNLGSDARLEVPDKAGNILHISINSYNIMTNH